MSASDAPPSLAPGVALVTGATGFVGSHLARRLLVNGFEVHALCRPASDFRRLADVANRIERVVAPLEDAALVSRAVAAIRPDYVFHLASSTVVAGATASAAELVSANFLGSVHLLDACDAVACRAIVTTGDSFEYAPTHGPLVESAACRPESLHGITKLAATLYAQAKGAAQGRPVVALRMFSTYGPGDHPRRLVPRVIAGAVDGTPLALSRPGIVRDWVYVDDVVDLYLEAAARAPRLAGGVFNAGSGRATDLGTIVATILALAGSRAQPQWGAFAAPAHDAHPWVADARLTFATFAWRPRVSLEDGLRRTLDAMRPRDGSAKAAEMA
jgi:nucleoside-diphosphate-sugar epimerase